MLLSIVTVNHNVRFFLEQCLHSIGRATEGISFETVVVDNDSSDGSRAYFEKGLPGVRFIWNDRNLGFAKANNQGMKATTGRYILFLNPDTLLSEGCLKGCIRHLEENPGTGAVGVRMMDGAGRFLKESRRGFPTPAAALFKLFGLSSLFPESPLFSRYHMGHLDPMRDHPTDVLSGAFLMVRRDIMERVGGFDEDFFMYGEDIDLSYRIHQSGFTNKYLATHPIIHFKGESTEKGNLRYVRMFYGAMAVFARKHYGKGRAGLLSAMLHAGIWLRASFSLMGLMSRRWLLPAWRGMSAAILSTNRKEGLPPTQILVAGTVAGAERVKGILSRNGMEPVSTARIDMDGTESKGTSKEERIRRLLQRMKVKELAVCSESISYDEAMRLLPMVPRQVRVSFSGNGTESMVGSGLGRG